MTGKKEKTQSIGEAEGTVQKYKDAEARLALELQGLREKLEREEVESGDRLLEGVFLDDTKKMVRVTQDLTALKTEIDTVSRALEAARHGVVKAEAGVMLAKATELRRQAADLRAEAKERGKKTSELLKALEEHEGCPYMPSFSAKRDWEIALNIPKTQALLLEAESLETQAAALEAEAERMVARGR